MAAAPVAAAFEGWWPMRQQDCGPAGAAPRRLATLVSRQRWPAAATLAAGVAGWGFLVWLAVHMDHPLAELMMPDSASWTVGSALAIWSMWAVMMAAMMLPSALPMVLAFGQLAARQGERSRAAGFVAAYLAVWFGFSIAATAAQWALQAIDWIDQMIVSTSMALNACLLLLAGAYQFSPLKRVCLARCRSPLAFLLGEWRPGMAGAFAMGSRHGLFCVGCCWALMALLFVGGVMNLAWIAALSVAVAIEKLAPGGERVAAVLGLGLLAVGAVRMLALAP